MTINEIKVKQFAEQIREDVELADAFGDNWVHVRCLKCHLERRHFTNEYVEKLAAAAVKDEDDIERIAKIAEEVLEEAAAHHGEFVASRLDDGDEWTVVNRGAVEAAYRKAYLDHMDDTGDLVDDLVQNGDGGMSAYEYARMNPGLYEGDLPDETWEGMLNEMEEKGWIKRNAEKED